MRLLLLLLLLFPAMAQAAGEACIIKPYVPYYIVDPATYTYVVQGSDGWVFNGQQDLFDHFSISSGNLALFQQLTGALHSHGTELVIAYHPQRSMAVPEVLPPDNPLIRERGYDARKARQHYAELIEQMTKAGVALVGTPDFRSGAGYFNKFEWHWSAAGAREMAEAVAAHIKAQGWMKPVRNQDPAALLTTDDFTKVTLLGTSFSAIPAYADALTEFLQSADILNAAIDGGGLDDSINAYLASASYRQSMPKILIWEIPGYYPLSGEQMATTLRRAIAAVYGDCSAVAATSYQLGGEGGVIDLPHGRGGYLALEFSKPLFESLALAYGAEGCIQFERPFLPPADGHFFYLLPDTSEAALQSLRLVTPVGLSGVTLQARLCPLP